MHFNIQGLTNKTDPLSILLEEHEVDIICLCEHWLRLWELKVTHIENFNLVSSYCRTDMSRGGVSVYCRNGIELKPLVCKHCIEKHFECCIAYVERWGGRSRLYIITVYRTPDSDFRRFVDALTDLLHDLFNASNNYVITGDININLLKNSPHRTNLLNLFTEYNIDRHIHVPTRITPHSSTCIDNIFADMAVYGIEVHDSYLSDHTYQICRLNKLPQRNNLPSTYKRKLNITNISTFTSLLNKEDWSMVYKTGDPHEAFDLFYRAVTYHYNCSFPIQKIKPRRSRRKWYTPQIKEMHDQLCEMEKLRRHLNDPNYTLQYRRFRNLYRETVRGCRGQINNRRILNCNNVSRESWKIINANKNKKESFASLNIKESRDGHVLSLTELANKFNRYFIALSNNGNQQVPNPEGNHLPNYHGTLFLTPTIPEEIINIIDKTTRKPASGTDDIDGKILKSVKNCIAIPLSFLINQSFLCGSFPNSLKESKCIPVFKNKGCKDDITNYRPICIQNQIAKIFEFAFNARLVDFLEGNDIILDCQNGFRQKKSTNTAISTCLEFVYKSLNSKDNTLALFYDLSRAFDSINHSLLFSKLYSVGVRGNSLSWATSYLENRTQTVVLEGDKSSTSPVVIGVPQGSILSPTLFLIFINNLSNSCRTANKTILYADDTNLILAHGCLRGLIRNANKASDEVMSWLEANNLTLNVDKTYYMRFLTKNASTDICPLIKIKNRSIHSVDCFKFLGVVLDSKLTWEPHINAVCSKLSSSCYLIRTLRDTVTMDVLRILYFGLVQSTLQYGIMFWGSSAHLHKALLAQKRIIRCMSRTKPRESCRPIFKKFTILTLPNLYIYSLILYIEKHKHLLPKASDSHPYATRGNGLYYQPYSRLGVGQRSPLYMGIKCYNKIAAIMQQQRPASFKSKLRRYLLENPFYSVSEFLEST